jgi:hypothetical protein
MIRKTFIKALDSCASMAELNQVISDSARARIATKFNMTQETDNSYINTDALQAARFELEGRPPSFVYAFSGFQTSHKQLAENIDIWVEEREKQEQGFEMKHFPATIATQGCFALRNAAPFSIKSKYAMGVGTDSAPIRLIVLQLMLALNRRLVADTSGIRRSLDPYLKQLQLPKIARGVVKVGEL